MNGELDSTRHTKVRGKGILASDTVKQMDENVFAEGCKLLLAAARGDIPMAESILSGTNRNNNNNNKDQPSPSTKQQVTVNFRDYDRRTALHVAASEGHLKMVEFLIEKGAHINRSDRWGGSPLDDAHRHVQYLVARYLRDHGATTGSADQTNNLITACASGDIDEVIMLLRNKEGSKLAIQKGDYDKRTPLHLACGEGHIKIVELLLNAGADINAKDRWGGTPLADAVRSKNVMLVNWLKKKGAVMPPPMIIESAHGDTSAASTSEDIESNDDELIVDFSELEMIERIGSGAFGEIYKCRWKGTLVASKCIKSAKIRSEWKARHQAASHDEGDDNDSNKNDQDDDLSSQSSYSVSLTTKDAAIADFRKEITILSKLRHPNICMLLAYSTTKDYEVIISELMRCSLLDVFRANSIHNTKLPKKTQIMYSQQLALGMNYLHSFKQPIIHRDLKPANLLIDLYGCLKIADFGLAKVRPAPPPSQNETINTNNNTENDNTIQEEEDDDEFSDDNEETMREESPKLNDQFRMTGETGSYRYMAPEVFRYEQYDETVDIYSYSMILYFIFVGHPPWPQWSGHKAVSLASLHGNRPDVPRHVDLRITSLMKMCWHENARHRPSFTQILEILNDYSKNVFGQDCDSVTAQGSTDEGGIKCGCVIQ